MRSTKDPSLRLSHAQEKEDGGGIRGTNDWLCVINLKAAETGNLTVMTL